jgi:FkbM family methyltransferase
MHNVLKQVHSLYNDFIRSGYITSGFRSYIRLSTDFCLSRAIRLRPVRGMDQERQIRLRGGGTLRYRLNRADIYTIHEVWIEEMYLLPADLKPHLFVDLGANIGLTSLWLARRYGCDQLIAVEPSPTNAALARKNLENGPFAARVVEAAAGSKDGTALFDAGPSPTNGRVVGENPAQNADQSSQYAVRVLSMESILRDLPEATPIDLIKIDIEGGEQSLLDSNTDWLQRVQTMIIEFHPELIDYPALIEVLLKSGLNRVNSICTNKTGANTLEVFRRYH